MDKLSSVKNQTKQLIESVPAQSRAEYLKWLRREADAQLRQLSMEEASVAVNSEEEMENSVAMMMDIADYLKENVPIDGVLPSEKIEFPKIGHNSDCDVRTSVHIDSFLYSDDDICDMDPKYCTKCFSRELDDLVILSHSMSIGQIRYVFQKLLPDVTGKTVVDVGSRLGPVLYGAYYFTSASPIVGVEMNADLCRLQNQIVDKYALADRVKVIHADICDQAEVVHSADVIILHNVFEFFADVETQKRIWRFLYETARNPGCMLVTEPSLEVCFEHLQLDLDLSTWVKPIAKKVPKTRRSRDSIDHKIESEMFDNERFHLYQVCVPS